VRDGIVRFCIKFRFVRELQHRSLPVPDRTNRLFELRRWYIHREHGFPILLQLSSWDVPVRRRYVKLYDMCFRYVPAEPCWDELYKLSDGHLCIELHCVLELLGRDLSVLDGPRKLPELWCWPLSVHHWVNNVRRLCGRNVLHCCKSHGLFVVLKLRRGVVLCSWIELVLKLRFGVVCGEQSSVVLPELLSWLLSIKHRNG
jgi:hypothetical protein